MKTIQFFCLSAMLLFFACKNQEGAAKATDAAEEATTVVEEKVTEVPRPGCTAILEGEIPESDALLSFKPAIKDGCIVLRLSYSGGCKDHDFQLYWNGAFAESIPPQTHLYLVHDSKGDHCRELKMEAYAFDLEKMKYSGLNEVQLTVHSGELEPVTLMYRYK